MIEVTFNKNLLVVKNHAKDRLVCCAISTIMYTCTAWFKKNEIVFFEDPTNTIIAIELKKKTKTSLVKLAMAFSQIQLLQKQYPKDIKVKATKSK